MTEHPDDLLHIASCRTCRDRFTADNVVNFNGDRQRGPERMREFLETARRLERERDGVEDVVARLLRTTPANEWSTLSEEPELQSSAAVEQLIEEVRNRVERTPNDALTLANAATSIAESLPDKSYPAVVLAQLCAMAWKERANTLRFLGRLDEAFASIEEAEARLSSFPAATFDRAVVHLVKAMIIHHLGQATAAFDLLRECDEIFTDYGDPRMLMCSGLIRGALLYNDERYSEAQTVFIQLRENAQEARDSESLARIESNLGYCATHAGDFRNANIHFSNGIALLMDMGARTEATRAERGAGRLLIAKGQVNSGLAYLRSARRAFADAGMVEDAILCGMEIVEVLVQRGDTAEGRELAHHIVDEVAAAGLGDRAVEALQRLESTLRDGSADPVVETRNVHAFLKSLHESLSA